MVSSFVKSKPIRKGNAYQTKTCILAGIRLGVVRWGGVLCGEVGVLCGEIGVLCGVVGVR